VSQRVEIRDGVEYRVTTLPSDKRLGAAASRKRAVFASLSAGEKREFIRARIRESKKRKRRRRRKGGGS
jgi:hypothetical protein